MPGVLFWLFLGGFVWVIGDLFQQFAAKYLGIGRGIPLSNTNQLWGLAWGALVFGELANADRQHMLLVIGGQAGDEFGGRDERRRWWDYAIVLTATGVFIALGVRAVVPPLTMDLRWIAVLGVVLVVSLIAGGWSLWRRTRFS